MTCSFLAIRRLAALLAGSCALAQPALSVAQALGAVGERSAAAAREAPGALSLAAALDLALASNPELAAATREVEATEAALVQSSARPNPAVMAELEDTRSATRSTTLQWTQPIELGGKRAARIEAAERAGDIAQAEFAARRAELRATVVAAFHDVLVAQEAVRLAGDSVALARSASEAAGKRVQAGKVSPVEETRARVAEAGVRIEAAQAEAALRAARVRLAANWGNVSPSFERAELAQPGAGDLPALPAPEAIESRLAASPNLRRARIEVQRRQALAAVERARGVPDLSVSVGVKRDAELGRNQALIGVSVPLPLFDDNRGNQLEALRREDKARDELAALQTKLGVEVRLARDRLAAARAEAQLLRDEVLPGAESAYAAASKGFELGKFDFLDVLDAQRTLFQSRSQVLRAFAEAHRAAAEIDRLLADETPASLARSSR